MDEDLVIIPPVQYNRYGWIPDSEDRRDLRFVPSMDVSLKRSFSLRSGMPPVLNQGKLGSCTANGICNAIRFAEMLEGVDDSKARSRLFVYYNERAMEGTVYEDSGAQIRDGIKSVNSVGACFEGTWPYDIQMFTVKPSQACYQEAKSHRALKYKRITQTVNDIKHGIQSGYPVIFGFRVFDSIRRPTVQKSGIIPLPSNGDQSVGGHCMVCCGWDDSRRLFLIMNSWGTEWGDGGYGYMSYDYLSNSDLASDFWQVTLVQ